VNEEATVASTSSKPRRSSARSSNPNRTPLLIGVGAVVIVLVVVLAVFTASERQESVGVDDLAGSPVMVGDDLPQFAGDTASDPALGARPPVVTGADFDGNEVTIGESGSPQLLMFLASWCPACQAELPEVVEWLEQGNLPEGVELTAIATGLDAGRPNWPPDAWLEREGYDGRALVDDADGSVAGAYGLSATPFWVALDADGQVAARVAGMIDMERLSILAEGLAEG
jgi:thiol-disulfide isomerase/thioredoxin